MTDEVFNENSEVFTETEFEYIAELLRGVHIILDASGDSNDTIRAFVAALEASADIVCELDEPEVVSEEENKGFFSSLGSRMDK